jgi:Cu-Zn family superoxide dismutase
MRRTPPVVILALCFALVAAACGDDSSGSSAESEDAASTTAVAPTTPVSAAEPAVREGTVTYDLPGDAVFPEGVAYDPATDRFLVSSTSDGTVFEVDRSSGEASVFSDAGADGRDTAVGLATDPDRRRLWVAGGRGQTAYVYDLDSGDLIADYEAEPVDGSLVNDVVVAHDGDAYLTDSGPRPTLFRVAEGDDGPGDLEEWLDLDATPIPTDAGINLNGIVATDDGRYVLAVHLTEGQLYRIDRETQEVTAVGDPGTLAGGDGMVLDGTRLWVVAAGGVNGFALDESFSTLVPGPTVTDETFAFPTTAAVVDGRLLVVNSQFDAGESPRLPFTVSEVPAD